MARLLIIILTALVVISDEGRAQTKNHLLRGASEIEIILEELTDPNSTNCGLTEHRLQAAAMYPLSSTKIRVVSSSEVLLYVNVNTLYLAAQGVCFSSISLEAFSYQNVTLKFSRDAKFVQALLWRKGLVVSTAKSRHERNVADSIEEITKRFITDWNLDNQ